MTTRGFRHTRQPWGASQRRPTPARHERHETLLRKREGGLQTLPGGGGARPCMGFQKHTAHTSPEQTLAL